MEGISIKTWKHTITTEYENIGKLGWSLLGINKIFDMSIINKIMVLIVSPNSGLL